jgi:hypothetical protein
MEETIYDCVLDKIVPIRKATTNGIQKYWSSLPDDGPVNHSIGSACWHELVRRGVCPRPEWWNDEIHGKIQNNA